MLAARHFEMLFEKQDASRVTAECLTLRYSFSSRREREYYFLERKIFKQSQLEWLPLSWLFLVKRASSHEMWRELDVCVWELLAGK